MSNSHHGSATTDFVEDMRATEPVMGVTGFQGKTQAELWAHICKTNEHIGNIVSALESDAKDRQKAILVSPANELSGEITQKMKERVAVLRLDLRKLGLGHKVVDNILRVEMTRLNSEYPVVQSMSDAEFESRAGLVQRAVERYSSIDFGALAEQAADEHHRASRGRG